MLALDYGSARCGCAISDPTGMIATPIEEVARPGSKRGMARIAALIAEREVEQVIVGLPLSLSGAESDQTRETREFAQRLARRVGPGVDVQMHDERFTTKLAAQSGGTRSSEDSRAAAHLLESWLSARTR